VHLPRHIAEQAVAELIAQATNLGAVDVAGEAVDGEPVDVLLDESLSASSSYWAPATSARWVRRYSAR
jgi:hypothetical protein